MNNIVLPSGVNLHGDTLRIYYGAGDSVIGTRSLNIDELFEELEQSLKRSQNNHSHTSIGK